jgi:L-fuculose-phosphate aldolase
MIQNVESLAREFETFGRLLVDLDLVDLVGGNLSVRDGESFWITRANTAKITIAPEALVRLPIQGDDPGDGSSGAMPIHRAIYRLTGARAVIHAHPHFATLLSFFKEEWMPLDDAGVLYLKGPVKVIQSPEITRWNDVAYDVARSLGAVPAVVLKWHGSFTTGKDLAKAFHNTQALESTARFLLELHHLAGQTLTPTYPNYRASSEK